MMQEEFYLNHEQRPQSAVISLLPEQEQQLALINHMASFSNMLIAVTGLAGSGKSTIAFELLRRHSDLELTLFITADIMFGIPSLLRRIGDVDRLTLPDNRSQAIEMLKQQAQQRAEQGKKLLVVIDQAEQIDANTLNEIAHLALLIPKGIAFILFGLTGYEQTIRTGPAQAAIHTQALPPLSEESTRRLLQQVYRPNQPLSLSETELIYLHRQGAGLPGALLLLADNYLGEQPNRAQVAKPAKYTLADINKHFPLAHVTALVFLAVALLVSYLYQPADADTEVVKQSKSVPVTEDVLRGLPLPPSVDPIYAQPAVETETPSNIAIAVVTATPDSNSSAQEDFNYPPMTIVEPTVVVPVSAEPKVSTAAPIEAETVVIPSRPTTVSKLALSDKEKLIAVKQGAIVQLFGSFEAQNAVKFKQQWQGQVDKTFYQYQTTNNGKPWHVVAVGVYKNKTEATQAIQKWPTKLRAEKPWVRDINDIKPTLSGS